VAQHAEEVRRSKEVKEKKNENLERIEIKGKAISGIYTSVRKF
jgi:hypothetical protein